MEQLRHLSLILLILLPTLAQDSQPVCRLITKYDSATETTTVQCELVTRDETTVKLSVRANTAFHGKEPNETAQFWFALASNQSRATRQTKPLFAEAAALSLVADATPIEVPLQDYHKDYFESVHLYSESVRAELPREALQKLMDAHSLQGQWGKADIKFSAGELAALKDFLARHGFAPSSR
jgi:hypothetical protein